MKRFLGALLGLMMVIVCLQVGATTASAATQSDAVSWAKTQRDTAMPWDVDGNKDVGCSDFVTAYISQLITGDPWANNPRSTLNGNQYFGASYPSDKFEKIAYYAGLVAQPGDILCFDNETWGHVAVAMEGCDTTYWKAIGQASSKDTPPHDQSGKYRAQTSSDYDYKCQGIIRPRFDSGSSQSAVKSSDTVLVLDYSSSMNGTPLENLKTSAALFCEAVVSAPGTHRVAIVAYGSTIKFQGFTELYNEMVAFLNNPVVSTGSTNIAGGLTKAKELVDTSSADVKNVLLMTDGIPNTGTSVTTGKYTSADHSSYRYANAVYNAAEALWSSCRLYTLGFFHSLTGSSLEFARRFFDDMENEGYWEVIDPAELHGDPQGFPPTAPLVLALSKKMRKAARVPPFLSRLPRQK